MSETRLYRWLYYSRQYDPAQIEELRWHDLLWEVLDACKPRTLLRHTLWRFWRPHKYRYSGGSYEECDKYHITLHIGQYQYGIGYVGQCLFLACGRYWQLGLALYSADKVEEPYKL